MARPNRLKSGTNAAIVLAATVAIAIFVNVLSGRLFGRLDLTEHGVNSLSDASKQAVASLDDLEVRVYISPDLPETVRDQAGQEIVLRGVAQKLRDKLEEYRSYSDGKMTVTYVTGDIVEQARKANLQIFSGEEATAKDNRLEFKQYALGASFHYKNVKEELPLAFYPEFYEFEVTRLMLRLKDKAEHSILMKDVLAAGEKLEQTVSACQAGLEAAMPQDDPAQANPFGLLSAEGTKARLDALRGAQARLEGSCGQIPTALTAAEGMKQRHEPLDVVIAVANAYKGAWERLSQALAGGDAQAQEALALFEELKAYAEAMKTEHQTLVDSPGQRRIGFVCAAQAFCPFPSGKPLVPQELRGVIGQKNPLMQQVVGQLDRITQNIDRILLGVERNLFKRRGFDIVRVDLQDEIPGDVESLVLFGPKAALSEWQLYQLDQFVMGGGSVVVFLNAWDVSLYNLTEQGEMTVTGLKKNGANIDQLLAHWGVAPRGDLVMEPRAHDTVTVLSLIRQGQLAWQTQRAFPFPMLPVLGDFDASSPLVRAVSSLTLPYATSLELKEQPGVTLTPLIRTSAEAVTTTDPGFPVDPTQQLARVAGQQGAGPQVVAAIATGELKSFFAGKQAPTAPASEGDPAKPDAAGKPDKPRLDSGKGRVLVIGSNLGLEDLSHESILPGFSLAKLTEGSMDVLEDFRKWASTFENWQVRLGQVQHTLQDNLQFLFNAMDWAVQQEGLVEIRSKQYQRRPLAQLDDGDRTVIEVVAIAGAPLAFALFGLGHWLYQRRRRQRIMAG